MTLVEVLMTTAVLGLGIAALAASYGRAQSGVRASGLKIAALKLAEQRLERLSTVTIDRLAACAGPVTGCRQSRTLYEPEQGIVGTYRCTQYVDEMGFPDPSVVSTGRFRIDTAVQVHPDPRQQTGAFVVTVSVCWSPTASEVEQVQVQRMLVPDV